jgi:hypothetical protein
MSRIQAENTARKLLIRRSRNSTKFAEITSLVPFSTATPDSELTTE